MKFRRIAARDMRMLVVARGLTALRLPSAVWWKTGVVGIFGAETRLEGGEMSHSGEGELLYTGLSTTQPPAAGCDGSCVMFLFFPSGCHVAYGAR